MNDSIVLTHSQVLGFIRRGLPLALICAAAFAVALYQWRSQAEPMYRAQAALVTQGSQVDLRSLGLPGINQAPLHVDAYSVAATSGPLLSAALASLGQPTDDKAIDDLRQKHLQIDARPEPQMLYVTVTAGSPLEAADLANAIAAQLEIWDRDRLTAELQRMVQLLSQRITVQQMIVQELADGPSDGPSAQTAQQTLDELRGQLDSVVSLSTNATSGIRIVRAATPPTENLGQTPLVFGQAGLVLGVLLAYAIIFALEIFNGRLYGVQDVQLTTAAPVLARVPKATLRRPVDPEVAVTLRANLGGSRAAGHLSALLVTGPTAGDDTAAAAMAVAESFAQHGMNTLLVDADLERPAIAKRYRVSGVNVLPLLACLRGQQGAQRPIQIPLINGARLSLIYENDASAEDVFNLLNGISACIRRWRSEYHVIVIRGAPVLDASDSIVLSESCDGVILSVNGRKAFRRSVVATVTRLKRAEVPLLGVIITGDRGRSARQPKLPSRLDAGAAETHQHPRPESPRTY